MEELETPTTATNNGETTVSDDPTVFFDDIDSACSTPYVSAPSSPGRGPSPPSFRFFYSAPASPVHFIPTSSSTNSPPPSVSKPSVPASSSSEFEFSAKPATTDDSAFSGAMSSADELFLNGQIRPMKLQRPPKLAPLIDVDEYETSNECDDDAMKEARGRDLDLRDRSIRRRTRSMSPLRTTSSFDWCKSDDQSSEIEQIGLSSKCVESKQSEEALDEMTSASGSSSRSSSVGRNTKRWIFLKDLLYRSKSEGRNNSHRYFWSSVSFSPIKDRKSSTTSPETMESAKKVKQNVTQTNKKPVVAGKVMNGIGKRPSPHELHYTANRAQAEEMRKKTFLPYRQGLFGFLGFSSKSTNGAMNHHGYARPLNPVSSR